MNRKSNGIRKPGSARASSHLPAGNLPRLDNLGLGGSYPVLRNDGSNPVAPDFDPDFNDPFHSSKSLKIYSPETLRVGACRKHSSTGTMRQSLLMPFSRLDMSSRLIYSKIELLAGQR